MTKEVSFTPGELMGYTPSVFQREFHKVRREQTYTTFVAHRRFGKTEACLAELITGCLTCPLPAPNYKYIAPTLKQAKEIAWAPLMKMISRMRKNGVRGIEVSRTDARVVFECAVNAPAILQFSGLEEPENLRGGYDDGMIVDEAATMKAGIWGEVLVPRLADRSGWAVITGTVKGMDQLYDFYRNGDKESDRYNPHWASLYYPISVTRGRIPWLTEDKLEKLAAGMGGTDSIAWRQEMELDWLANDGSLLISLAPVRAAMKRSLPESDYRNAPNVLGVDTSGHGADKTEMVRRQGRVVFSKKEFGDVDSLYLANQIVLEHRSQPLDAVFVDCTGGYGLGVVDNLRRMVGNELTIYEINFSAKANDSDHYFNKRAEMWDEMARWVLTGVLPNDETLCKDLTNVRYEIDRGRLKLEEKKLVKQRLGRSPDTADALALTFAYPVSASGPAFFAGSGRSLFAQDKLDF
jgi:hypothetical protein